MTQDSLRSLMKNLRKVAIQKKINLICKGLIPGHPVNFKTG